MKDLKKLGGIFSMLLVTSLMVSACGSIAEPLPENAATPTPTEMGGGVTGPIAASDPCAGLTGSVEMQILVGPSEAVGMEPVAVGRIPFTVVSGDGGYIVEGGAPINFDEQVYEAEWGTYTVNFDADTEVQGSCISSDGTATLDLRVIMEGEQMVSIRAEGFSGDYPWSGTQTLDVTLPAEEGATQSGEGWTLVLHLDQ